MTPVADPERLPGPVVVMLPAEIDIANGAGVGQQLCSAFAPGVTVVIADMTSTVFCDSSGISQLVLAHHCAAAHHAPLRLAVPHTGVLDVLKVVGLDRLLVRSCRKISRRFSWLRRRLWCGVRYA